LGRLSLLSFYDEFNFYFVSGTKTIHAQNILKNPKVSITIADSKQDPKGKKVGFQARGIAKAVNSAEELKQMIIAWNKCYEMKGIILRLSN